MHVVRMENNSRRSKNFEQLTHSGLRRVDVSTAENDEQRQKSPPQADLAPIEYYQQWEVAITGVAEYHAILTVPPTVFEIRQRPSHQASSNIDTSTAGPSNSRKQQNIDDWKKLYRQAFTHVRSGGWVESLDIDIETHSENPKIEKDESHIFKKCCKLFLERGRKTGRTWEIARDGRQEECMREAGFTDLFSKSWKLPVGGWLQDKKLKQIGLYNGAFIDHSVDAFAIFPVGEILGWSKEEVTVLVSQMRKALREPRALPYFNPGHMSVPPNLLRLTSLARPRTSSYKSTDNQRAPMIFNLLETGTLSFYAKTAAV
ncbi:hypothetical protein DER44DRAFT_854856 [Fusarium oxysporum]|nr:hypothetical protein DER44DRAFT_854856 [Fusarium oxysporum]